MVRPVNPDEPTRPREDSRIRQKTIEAQLAREFADRLEFEADAWLQMATAKRQKAIEYRMKADALTVEAGMIREAKRAPRKKQIES